MHEEIFRWMPAVLLLVVFAIVIITVSVVALGRAVYTRTSAVCEAEHPCGDYDSKPHTVPRRTMFLVDAVGWVCPQHMPNGAMVLALGDDPRSWTSVKEHPPEEPEAESPTAEKKS